MQYVVIPAAGIALFFAGLSATGFALSAETTITDNLRIYMTSNAVGIVSTFVGASPLLCKITPFRLKWTSFFSLSAMIAFLIATVYGIIESYNIHVGNTTTSFNLTLYFVAWIQSMLCFMSNSMLTVFALITYVQYKQCALETPELCSDIAKPQSHSRRAVVAPERSSRRMPKSRSAIRSAR
jgi:hypothetical protein